MPRKKTSPTKAKPAKAKATQPKVAAQRGPNPASQAGFLAAYVLAGANVTAAAKAAGINPCTHYDWLANDPTYPERLEAARQQACDAVEAEIFRRGQLGYDEPVIYKGELCLIAGDDGKPKPLTVRRYSDTLLIFRAKALMPEKYGDKTKLEHTTPDNAPLEVVFNEGWYGNDAHERQAAKARLAEAAGASTADPAVTGPL